ncbi:hypothetical protein SERLADRAFT_437208 [Serpula lacrymans var. lacrymans S7.9]|uniref:Amidohydrolase-related domain-containing protein n=1 Tax=Serpula lacrymans var. lacrymans (strain S7.9) TaxID=578457 RepID=F8NSZ4_SERL9|nr:uncharacterized protein SERLADRAFT_437208 [Serpula lacrymans var. lacrymans S7.9]EGO25467.1 hypothetical protein SERLADRAFT_437208 [Serpula lacrymans var. lacrymans S7.9]
MDKDSTRLQAPSGWAIQHKCKTKFFRRLAVFAALALSLASLNHLSLSFNEEEATPAHIATAISRCQYLAREPGPPSDFHQRTSSDRYEVGTKATLIINAKIWTGEHNGTEVIDGGILMDKGVIVAIGRINPGLIQSYKDLVITDVHGSWVTPGIVDMHSHLGDASSPELAGAIDDNSEKGPIEAWLRSLDGLNTHDDSYPLSISGGVTTSLVLPGSANAIAGQGFAIKLRKTAEHSPTSMLLEPPYTVNSSFPDYSITPRWRQLKQACGENPSSVYSQTRMDNLWSMREAYDKARTIKEEQDAYCSAVLNGQHQGLGKFPDDLKWEMLVDVLRGRVKVQTHCYEAVDLDALVRLSNEFKFPLAAVHHASEAYLVPELLKKAYGQAPGVALFATNSRYKREAYRSSEFAPRILAENGISVAMKSDHPVLNSRYLLYEAQQAHFYGMPTNLALASVISTPARLLGLDHRVGYAKEGWDADVVVWDSHPLSLGATPMQVYIDGISQLKSPHVISKPQEFQKVPEVPNFDKEAATVVEYEGLPPLQQRKSVSGLVLFRGVKTFFLRGEGSVREVSMTQDDISGVVVVNNGAIFCSGPMADCSSSFSESDAEIIDLKGGSIFPGLVSFGSPLGTSEIEAEDSTNDGNVNDPLTAKVPSIIGGDEALIRAVDGLQFGTRDALLAYRAGVTLGITAPSHNGFYAGLSTAFSLSAPHKLHPGAVAQDVAGLHVAVRHFDNGPSVSTQIATLRRLLLHPVGGESGYWFKEVTKGNVPLVIEAHSADIIATLVRLKMEVEEAKGRTIKLTITGASEAHILAKELGEAGVGVILSPVRPFPTLWEDRRILPGPPLSQQSSVSKLVTNNVTVGIGVVEIWEARNARFDLAWASLEAGGEIEISKQEAIALASTNIEKLVLGYTRPTLSTELVVTEGGDLFDLSSKVVAVINPSQHAVEFL